MCEIRQLGGSCYKTQGNQPKVLHQPTGVRWGEGISLSRGRRYIYTPMADSGYYMTEINTRL